MQINKPDQGVLKGMGRLEIEANNNKKYFPRVRNINQFDYTHAHKNDYLTSFQRFFSAKHAPKPMKPSQNANASTLMLGNDQVKYDSLSRTDYRRFEKVIPPKPILQKEQGIALGQEPSGKAHFTTTVMEKFGLRETKERPKVTFKDRGIQRFNPITGQMRTQTFGFEDFTMGRRNNYIAHNVGGTQGYDIISGRKLTHN